MQSGVAVARHKAFEDEETSAFHRRFLGSWPAGSVALQKRLRPHLQTHTLQNTAFTGNWLPGKSFSFKQASSLKKGKALSICAVSQGS